MVSPLSGFSCKLRFQFRCAPFDRQTLDGVTFEPVFGKEATHSAGDIAVDQKNPDIVWVGTGERANRQSSSWGDGININDLVIHAHDGTEIQELEPTARAA